MIALALHNTIILIITHQSIPTPTSTQVHRLTAKVGEVVTQKKLNFQSDYNALVDGLIAEGTWAPNDQNRGHPALTEDQLQEAGTYTLT